MLSATLAWAAVTLSGCGDDSGGGGTGGAAGGGSAGTAGGGGAGGSGPAYACATSMTGSHMHPLTIPSSDVVRGHYDAPYLLADGGTGHTHELPLTAYDFVYFQAGATVVADSTTTDGHVHKCTITCTPS